VVVRGNIGILFIVFFVKMRISSFSTVDALNWQLVYLLMGGDKQVVNKLNKL